MLNIRKAEPGDIPLILELIHEESQELFDLLIDPFCLAVSLWW